MEQNETNENKIKKQTGKTYIHFYGKLLKSTSKHLQINYLTYKNKLQTFRNKILNLQLKPHYV